MAEGRGALRYEAIGTDRERAFVVFPRDTKDDRLLSVNLAEEPVAECMLAACRAHGADLARPGLKQLCFVVRAAMRGGASQDAALEEARRAAAAWSEAPGAGAVPPAPEASASAAPALASSLPQEPAPDSACALADAGPSGLVAAPAPVDAAE